MAKSKDALIVTSSIDPGLADQINFSFQRLLDRIDKLEGLRGELETASGTFTGPVVAKDISVSKDDTKLHSME
jgi:hypothetical protein